MKKIIFLITIFCALNTLLSAQSTIIISGTVTDSANSNPISNHQVTIVITDSSSFNFQQNFTTNLSGNYSAVIQNFPVGGALIYVSTIDCNNLIQQQYLWTSPYVANFSICVAPPSCQASFISYPDSVNPLSIHFNDQTIGNPTSWLWDFGDSNTSTLQNPIHTFAQNGVYAVSLVVYCSNTMSTYIDTITISGGTTGCQANFTSWLDSINPATIHFQDLSTGSPLNWNWNFGDNTTSTLQHPSHSYSQAGKYNVILLIAGPGCQSSYSDSVVVNVACSNSFNYNGVGYQFNFQGSVNNSGATYYYWDYGDSSPMDTGQNVNHYFNASGSFQVCLTSISINPIGDSCIAYSCQTIIVPAGPTANLFGQVFLDTNIVDTGYIILYNYNSFDSVYVPIDTANIDHITVSFSQISIYYFDQLAYGKYLVKAFLYPSSNYYNDYMPTYSGNTFAWNQATPIFIDSISDTLGFIMPVNMNKINPPSGNTTVYGYVFEGSSKTPGDPVPDILIYLVEYGIVVVDYTLSDQNGYYEFNNLESKPYNVYAEMVSKQTYPLNLHPDGSGNPFTNYNIFIHSNIITGMDVKEQHVAEYNIFPNPFVDNISIE
ncbi:PKD domain-containing protein, partial [candidate division KSB1 bacterium]